VLAGLGDLLRRVLDGASTQEVPLKQELDSCGATSTSSRFGSGPPQSGGDAEAETLDAQVPYLILQPLVENAIRHGIAPRSTVVGS